MDETVETGDSELVKPLDIDSVTTKLSSWFSRRTPNSKQVIISLPSEIDERVQQIAERLSKELNLTTVPVNHLADKEYHLEQVVDNKGVVVTGYNAEFAQRTWSDDHGVTEPDTQEVAIQGKLREFGNSPKRDIIVLSKGDPHQSIFDSSYPWYNGPFQKDNSVFQLNNSKSGLNLTNLRISSSFLPEETKWVHQKTVALQ